MRNAVEYALAGGLLVAGALGPPAGAALAAPPPRAPAALVLPAAPERAAEPAAVLVCGPEAADVRPAPEIVCVRLGAADGRGGSAAGAPADTEAGVPAS